MSRKLSLVESSREGKLPATAKEATLGAVFPGYVASATAAGVFVRFLGRLTGLAPPSQLTDGTTGDVHEMFPVGKDCQRINTVGGYVHADAEVVALIESVCHFVASQRRTVGSLVFPGY